MYEPMRICSVCRKKSPKTELLRVVRIGGEYIVDTTGKAQGRGAYICKDKACIEKCCKKKLLNRSFKTQLGEEVYEALANIDIQG
ncbi:MAG: YlxR family protein [Clostridia bacterium]|nr:YlxR family protein [Clostridia bacterium]